MITPGFVILLSSLSLAVFLVKEKHIIVPIVCAMCFLPADIAIIIGGLNFQALRIIAICALLRATLISDLKSINYNTIDKLFFSYTIIGSIIYVIASLNKSGAFIYKSGIFIDSIILYFIFRKIIQSKEDILLIFKTFSACLLLLVPFAIYEFYFAENLFSILGRNRIAFRDGAVRAAATFSHPILFGSFAAALAPIMWAHYKIENSKLSLLSFLACLFLVFTSMSSGPIVVLVFVLMLIYFFRWKKHGSLLFWTSMLTACFIHIVREMPLWHFIYVRISIKGSSTGWHRYLLVEAAVRDFWEWWLLGYGDIGPQWHLKYWPKTHAKFTDITNHYLLEGVRGGFFTMLLFIILCYKCVKALGSLSVTQSFKSDQWLWWGLTVMMTAHCITFLSVAYFGQITMLLYMTIAIASLSSDEAFKKMQI